MVFNERKFEKGTKMFTVYFENTRVSNASVTINGREYMGPGGFEFPENTVITAAGFWNDMVQMGGVTVNGELVTETLPGSQSYEYILHRNITISFSGVSTPIQRIFGLVSIVEL